MSVVVVTAAHGDETSCATSTTNYVSVRPPILCVALAPGSRTARLIEQSGRFSVSVLTAAQADVARRAGRPADGPDKLAAVGIEPERFGAAGAWPPGVADSAAVLWCEVSDTVTAGDHQVIFGLVRGFRGSIGAGDSGDAAGLLLRHQRQYLATGQPVTLSVPDGYPI